jgi:Domain of unknown function (DUF1876)
MFAKKQWRVDVFIDEHEDDRRTQAEARLQTGDTAYLRGHGVATRHPRDLEVPEIGDELAVARALSDLAHRLLEAAARDIEEITHTPTSLRG